jgi:hypothetical protein
MKTARPPILKAKPAKRNNWRRNAAPVFEQQKKAGDASVCAAVLARTLTAKCPTGRAQWQRSICQPVNRAVGLTLTKEWDYEQLRKFGSHAGKPGNRDGVK